VKTIRVDKNNKHDIFIGRPSKFGNPFVIGEDGNRTEVIAKFEQYMRSHPDLQNYLKELDGRIIACWCRTDQSCHGDVYLKLLQENYFDSNTVFEF
jgi:hypothetical protein